MQEQLESSQEKCKEQHENHRIDHHFHIGDQVWLHISKKWLQGEGRKLKPIKYEHFTILDKFGNNSLRLEFPPYLQMYSIVNVENLKLYETPIIVDQDVQVQVPYVDEYAHVYLNEL